MWTENEDGEDTNFFNLSKFADKKDKEKKKIKLPKDAMNDDLDIIYFPTNKEEVLQRENMKNGRIGKHPMRCIINGASGAGKSNLMTNLFCKKSCYGKDIKKKNCKNYFDKIFIFSPTAELDDLILYLDIPEERIFSDYSSTALTKIIDTQKKMIIDKGLKASPRICVILDDIQNDAVFLRSPSLKKIFISGRQHNLSVFLCSQSWTLTPRYARMQASNIFFFAGDGSEQELLMKEYCPPQLEKEEFKNKIIKFATTPQKEKPFSDDADEPWTFLHINKQAPMKERYRKKLKYLLEINK